MATRNLRSKLKRTRSISPESLFPPGPVVLSTTSPTPSASHQILTPPPPPLPATGSPTKAKKLKVHSSYTTESPFPDFKHPTPTEAMDVHNLLSKVHRGSYDPIRRKPVAGSNSAETCGGVPNVIEALIGTILSQNTSGKNSTRAKMELDAAFGRNNFAAIAQAPRERVVDAIRSGGLANKKAGVIQDVLRSIKAQHGDYSLQHLAAVTEDGVSKLSDDEIMKELISYDGVGPKTASCVLLFCLGRDSFAVDTHVFRLSKLLGWVPPSADRIRTQAHLDLRVPPELKYGLHVLMIQHGRSCKGCKSPGSREPCILKSYLKEKTGKLDSDMDSMVVKMEDPVNCEIFLLIIFQPTDVSFLFFL